MKTQILKKAGIPLLLWGLSITSFKGNAQEHITLSLENITTTSNTIEYDLLITNDGTTDLKLAACAFGINYSGQILNGGEPSESKFSLIPETQSQALAGLSPYSLKQTHIERMNQLRLAMAPALKENSPMLSRNIQYKVGRFRFTNSRSWTNNSNPDFTLNEFNVIGMSTSLGLAYINNSTRYSAFSTALKNLTCKVVHSPALNPSKANIINENSVFDAQNQIKVNIYPNPAQDIIHIDFNTENTVNTVVKISDVSGRLIKTTQARSEKGYNNMNINLAKVVAGLYTIQVYQNDKLIFVEKITKKD